MGIKNSIIVALKQLCDSQKKPDASREKEMGLKRNKTRDGNFLLTGTVTYGGLLGPSKVHLFFYFDSYMIDSYKCRSRSKP